MAAKQGRLFVKKSGEGGADAHYDGAHVSDFQKSAGVNKPTTNFAQVKPRFDDVNTQAPEIDVRQRGISDSASGKGVPAWEARHSRFEDIKDSVGAGDYDTTTSDFTKAASNTKPSPMMVTPEKQRGRGGWMDQADQIATPPPSDLPSTFNVKNKPSPFSSAGTDRFQAVGLTHGEPALDPSLTSEFAKAASKTKPSPQAMQGSTRFKNDVVSYGDPGAQQTQSDLERQQLESRIARQKQQAESTAQRDLDKYNQ